MRQMWIAGSSFFLSLTVGSQKDSGHNLLKQNCTKCVYSFSNWSFSRTSPTSLTDFHGIAFEISQNRLNWTEMLKYFIQMMRMMIISTLRAWTSHPAVYFLHTLHCTLQAAVWASHSSMFTSCSLHDLLPFGAKMDGCQHVCTLLADRQDVH